MYALSLPHPQDPVGLNASAGGRHTGRSARGAGAGRTMALAGALASEANLLLLDEPTALLDPNSQKTVLKTVQRLCQRKKNPITALWITHRLSELDLADGAATMQKGKVGAWKSSIQIKRALQPLAARRV